MCDVGLWSGRPRTALASWRLGESAEALPRLRAYTLPSDTIRWDEILTPKLSSNFLETVTKTFFYFVFLFLTYLT